MSARQGKAQAAPKRAEPKAQGGSAESSVAALTLICAINLRQMALDSH